MKLLLVLLGLSLLGACASPARDSNMPPQENSMQEGHLPTPFSAEQIRDACGEGAFRTFKMETPKGVITQTMTFHKGDDEGTTFTILMTDESGKELINQVTEKTAWTEFQSHASCVAAESILTREMLSTAAGDFDCWVYVSPNALGLMVTNYFSVDLPGPPILSLGINSDGELASHMELVDFNR